MTTNPAIADKSPADSASGAVTAPRPPGAEDIARMMADAEARAQVKKDKTEQRRAGRPRWRPQATLLGALAAGLAVAAGIAAYGLANGMTNAATALAVVAAALALGLLVAVFWPGRPAMLANVAIKRAAGKTAQAAAELASLDMLKSLSIAERVLEGDVDARLITRGDGVVVYANAAYFRLAREAGVAGPAGLPPRIDRLFAQQGSEATKVFRLCRAAKSGAEAAEVVYQQMGLEGGGARRRFETAVRPVEGAKDLVAWRLRELPIEEKEHDALAASYADYVRPVFALERSGQIAWANAAMRRALGLGRHELHHLDDVVLGETDEIIKALWRADSAPAKADVRRRDADPAEAAFSAFRRGGVGEGFVCVDMEIHEESAEAETTAMAGEIAEAPFGLAVVEGEIGREARIVEANRTFTDVFDHVKKNTPLSRVLSAAAIEDIASEIRRKSAGGAPAVIDVSAGDGAAARTFGVYARPVKRRRGGYGTRRTLLYTVEVTDRKRMEADHTQDQKLKAIGFIAGEVAHDFNNLLQVIQGNCEQLMLRHPAGDPAWADLVLIRENAQRAANLTKQLLAYSRKQTLTRKVQSVTDILLDFSRFLDRAVGEKVKLDFVNGRGLPNVKVDRTQFETAIMNLAVNARDAMGAGGGKIAIRTARLTEAEAAALNVAGLGAGEHVLIELADTGPGVPPEIMGRIFDPFFTTKDEGKGTGLGLSTVHGIIGQMGGAIAVENAADGGAVFKVYLPAHQGGLDDGDDAAPAAAAPSADYSGSGRILVVEDEDPVRTFVVQTLERSGYEVTPAEDGLAALDILKEDRGFDLILTDVMMPEIDGPSLVERARAELGVASSVIFMSGYAETAVREQMDRIGGARYIQKPFPMVELGACVKETLLERKRA